MPARAQEHRTGEIERRCRHVIVHLARASNKERASHARVVRVLDDEGAVQPVGVLPARVRVIPVRADRVGAEPVLHRPVRRDARLREPERAVEERRAELVHAVEVHCRRVGRHAVLHEHAHDVVRALHEGKPPPTDCVVTAGSYYSPSCHCGDMPPTPAPGPAPPPSPQPGPPWPAQCDAFNHFTDICYAGKPSYTQTSTDLGKCCELATQRRAGLFNHYPANSSCELISAYTTTFPCAGALAYRKTEQQGAVAGSTGLPFRMFK